MKTRIIYRGEEIDVPSSHAARLVKNGIATLPKIAVQSNRGRGAEEPKAPEQEEVAAGATDATSTATVESAADAPASRQYRRRDMKAQD